MKMTEGPLDALAERLATPARSGFYLTKNELIALAREVEGSLRVNERKRMLADVLKSPASPEALGHLVARLEAIVRGHQAHYRALVRSFPRLEAPLTPWIARCDSSLRELADVRDELED